MIERQRSIAAIWIAANRKPYKAMDGSPDRMIAGSVACNAVLRWGIDADNVVLKMR
jgi:hypothetical protein